MLHLKNLANWHKIPTFAEPLQKAAALPAAVFPTFDLSTHSYPITMKKDIHPSNYREVVFKDMSNEEIFITRSTIAAKDTIEIDGVTYPLVKLEITSSSHPFFTGKQKLVDTAGRVDKFMSRYGNRKKK
jgi:large subunit ribosomal protein L31